MLCFADNSGKIPPLALMSSAAGTNPRSAIERNYETQSIGNLARRP